MKAVAATVVAVLLAMQTSSGAAAPAGARAFQASGHKTTKLDIQTLSTHADRVTGG
ncbi:MAG: hypothetical protein JF601_01385, partial [Acidobacteria bacterium]|nr:hypothetical protein [Acidobacteriota bacterium]